MSKQLKATAGSVSAVDVDRMAVGGTVTEGTAGTVGRHVTMSVDVWTVCQLLATIVSSDDGRAQIAQQLRHNHPERSWRSGQERQLDVLMRTIADVIDEKDVHHE